MITSETCREYCVNVTKYFLKVKFKKYLVYEWKMKFAQSIPIENQWQDHSLKQGLSREAKP
jgi:hypothetical protein